MSQLDEKITKLKEEFDRGSKSKISSIASVYHSRIWRAKKRGDMTSVKKLAKEARLLPAMDFDDPGFKKLSYVRYADD